MFLICLVEGRLFRNNLGWRYADLLHVQIQYLMMSNG